MGISDSIRRNMPGAPSSIAKHMLKHYLEAKAKYPHFAEEQIFSKMLTDRYAVIKGMSVDDMERIVSQTDTLVELTMAVVEHENPIAMSETYREETLRDIFSFFVENEAMEFEKFRQRVDAGNAENNQVDTYRIESQIASLIYALELSDFENLEAFIVLNKDYTVAYRVAPIISDETIAKVRLQEVSEYPLIQLAKKEGAIGAAFVIDMFAKNALAILLKRAKKAKGTDYSLAAGYETPGKEDLRQTEAVMPDEKELSETSSKPINTGVFTDNAKNMETPQPINDQEYNYFSCPSCNKSLRIDKSFVSNEGYLFLTLNHPEGIKCPCGKTIHNVQHEHIRNDKIHSNSMASKGFFKKLLDGDYGLAKTYWLYGFPVVFVANLIIRIIESEIVPPVFFVIVLSLSLCQIALLIGIWRASNKYSGAKIWAIFAKMSVVISSVAVVIVVILLANVVKTGLAQKQSNFDLSPQPRVTFEKARKQEYDNPVTSGIEQKHTSEKVDGTYKLGYERGLTLVKKLATNDDAKIYMLCDEAMEADHIVNSLYLIGCVNGYKSYFVY